MKREELIIRKQRDVIDNLKEVGQLYFKIRKGSNIATKQDVEDMAELVAIGEILETELKMLESLSFDAKNERSSCPICGRSFSAAGDCKTPCQHCNDFIKMNAKDEGDSVCFPMRNYDENEEAGIACKVCNDEEWIEGLRGETTPCPCCGGNSVEYKKHLASKSTTPPSLSADVVERSEQLVCDCEYPDVDSEDKPLPTCKDCLKPVV